MYATVRKKSASTKKEGPKPWCGPASSIQPCRETSPKTTDTDPFAKSPSDLEVSSLHDSYEKEADRVSSYVAGNSAGPMPHISSVAGGLARRKEDGTGSPPPGRDAVTNAVQSPGPGEPLSTETKKTLESRMGADLSGVRVHRGRSAEKAAAELKARAFTVGGGIWLGSGESPNDIPLMAHEATHVIQQGSAGSGPVRSLGKKPVQRSLWSDISGVAGAVWDKTGGRLVDAAGKAIEMGAEFFWAMIQRLAPALVPLLREISDKGIFGFLYEKISSALARVFAGLSARSETVAFLVATFTNLAAEAKDILSALAAGDCKPMFAAIERLKNAVAAMAGKAWEKITDFFHPIGEFFTQLWQSFGAPVVDWLSRFAGDIWAFIKDIGARIWEWTLPVRSALGAAWNWVKEKLGIGSGEGNEKGGLIQWVKDKASEVWGSVKKQAEPLIAPMRAVAEKVKSILPLEAIIKLRDKVKNWLSGVASMTASLDEEEGGIDENQDLLREKILPAVLSAVAGLRTEIINAGLWVSGQIGSLVLSVTDFLERLRANPVLGAAGSALGWLQKKATELSVWAQSTVAGVFSFVGNGLVRMASFIEPILNTLRKVFEVLADLMGRLPDLVFGKVWKLIPACIKNPVMDFIINKILKNIPVFGELFKIPDLWSKVKDTALKILKKIFVDGDLLRAAWTFFKAVLNILGVPPELVLSIVNKAAGAVMEIITKPVNFMINLLRAVKEGFLNFFGNIGSHLLAGVGNWLFGQLSEAGIKPPEDLSFKSILSFVMDVLGITVDRVFERLEKKTGAAAAKIKGALNFMKGAWEWVVTLVKEGPAGLWRMLAEKISNLWDSVINGVIGWLSNTIIKQAAKKVLSMLDPSGVMAVVNSIIAIYKAIQSFMKYLKQMLEIVNSVLSGVLDIANGVIDKAAAYVENALAGSIPIAIGFLANQLGLGGLGSKIKEMVGAVRKKVEGAIDWLIDKAISAGAAILKGLKSAAGAVLGWWKKKASFKQGKDTHTLSFEGEGAAATLMVKSTPTVLEDYISKLRDKHKGSSEAQKIIDSIEKEAKEIDKLKKDADTGKELTMTKGRGEEIEKHFDKIAALLASKVFGGKEVLPPSKIEWEKKALIKDSIGVAMKAEPLSLDPGGNAGSEPHEESDIWLSVNRRKNTYVRGHLLNHHVHGPGENKNLIPIMRDLNTLMETRVESKVKEHVLGKKEVMSYSVTAEFNGHGDRKNIPDEKLLPTALNFVLNFMKIKKDAEGGKPEDWEVDNARSLAYDKSLPNKLPHDTPADVRPEKAEPVNLSKASKDEMVKAGMESKGAEGVVELRKKRGDKSFYSYSQLEEVAGLDYAHLLKLSDMGLVKLR